VVEIDLAAIDVSELSDEDAVALATVLEFDENAGRWQTIIDVFPRPDPAAWPYPHEPTLEWRSMASALLQNDPGLRTAALYHYEHSGRGCHDFVNHWCITYDPRNATRTRPAKLPFVMFPKQEDLVDYLLALLVAEENGLIEKSRDMGATWLACCFSVWLWRFRRGAAVGWGSRKEILVDKLGDPDSIFEKMRMVISALPAFFMPAGFSPSIT
jgi:phage terminase large subunit